MNIRMPKKQYVKKIPVDGEPKWVVGFHENNKFHYWIDSVFGIKEDAVKKAYVKQLLELQAAMDEVWDEGVKQGHFGMYEDKGNYLA